MGYEKLATDIKTAVIDVPDFPKPGILFRDITPILADSALRQRITEAFWASCVGTGVTAVAGMESRGFMFGVPLADACNVSFVPIRKPGKLPREVYREQYGLEYGQDELQIHRDALTPSDKVVIIDDLLATGGTAEAAAKLVERAGAQVVKMLFVIELLELGGREHIAEYDLLSLAQY